MPKMVVSKDGTRIATWRSGEGRPLVLVHGTSVDHTRWSALLPFLEQHATVYTMDRRGRGASGDAPEYDIQREYEDVAEVVDAVATDHGGPVDLFGHSYGALCALEASRRTHNVGRLILYEPTVLPPAEPSGFAARAEALLREDRRDEVVTQFLEEIAGMSHAQIEALRGQPSWHMRLAVAHTLPREDRAVTGYGFEPARFHSLRVPTLMLVGSRSPARFRASTDALATALPTARVTALAGEQHHAIVTAPQKVATAVLRFLRTSAAEIPA
jgi:pimeloyl-ACP methyl ester carboxylesterase